MTVDMLNKRARGSSEAGEIESFGSLIKRLPVTMRPSLNGQFTAWDPL